LFGHGSKTVLRSVIVVSALFRFCLAAQLATSVDAVLSAKEKQEAAEMMAFGILQTDADDEITPVCEQEYAQMVRNQFGLLGIKDEKDMEDVKQAVVALKKPTVTEPNSRRTR